MLPENTPNSTDFRSCGRTRKAPELVPEYPQYPHAGKCDKRSIQSRRSRQKPYKCWKSTSPGRSTEGGKPFVLGTGRNPAESADRLCGYCVESGLAQKYQRLDRYRCQIFAPLL